MLQDIYYQYKSATMMLFQREGEEVVFLGTAFLVHTEGYLLTAAHLITGKTELMVVPVEEASGFVPSAPKRVSPIAAELRGLDHQRDIALLRFSQKIEISMPDHIIGIPEEVPVGSAVACLGFPFGHYHIYSPVIKQAVVCAKILSGNETRLLLFDTMVHDGSRGAPLINLSDGRIIGVVGGRFEPQDLLPQHLRRSTETPIKTNVSYAVSIDHASGLMEDEALTTI